jgi:glucose-1-phosphate cytidylyltransferase
MKAVILAGGYGTRMSEESLLRPKPMVEIGGRPMLWHIMKIYAAHGITDFVLCLGYKGYMIKEFFANYYLHGADVTIDTATGKIEYHEAVTEPWRVTLVDTGLDSMTGGRLRRVARYLGDGPFCMTYGDGVGAIDIRASIDFHRRQGKLATLTAVTPPGRFGALDISRSRVERFTEKPPGDGAYISGGFFVLEPGVIDLIEGDQTVWEQGPMETLAARGELMAYRHSGFWHPMDTLRDTQHLESLWRSGEAPWKVW